MQTATITKTEYKKILKNQEELSSRLNDLQKIVFKVARQEREVKPSVIKRWEKKMKEADQGKGKRFDSLSSFRLYLKAL